MPDVENSIQGVASRNRVVTLAGDLLQGETDDVGQLASFDNPQGITMTSDGPVVRAALCCWLAGHRRGFANPGAVSPIHTKLI